MCISLSCRQRISIMDYFSVFPPTCSDNVCSCVCVCRPSLGMAKLSAVDFDFLHLLLFLCSFAYSGPPISDGWGSIFLSKAHLPTELGNFQPIEFFLNVTFCISFISRMHVSRLHNRAPNIILFKNSALWDSNLKVTEMFT